MVLGLPDDPHSFGYSASSLTFLNTTAQVGLYRDSALATFRRKNRSCVFFDGARPICDRRVAVRIGGL